MKKILIMLCFLLVPLLADEAPAPKTPAAPQVQAATDQYESTFMKTIFVLISVLVLVVLTIWMFRRLSSGRFSKLNYMKNIKILEKRPLSPKSMLYLVEIGDKKIVLAESQIEIRALTTLDWPDNDDSRLDGE